jgi:hypothetical protein
LTRVCFIAVLIGVVLSSSFQSAAAFDGNRKGFVLGYGAGVGVLSDEDRWGLHTNLKIGWGLSDRALLYYAGNSSIFEGGALLEPTLTLSYYFDSDTPTVYLNGGLGYTGNVSVMGESSGPHLLAGVGWEFDRHWSVELLMINIYIEPNWLTNFALTVNVLGF